MSRVFTNLSGFCTENSVSFDKAADFLGISIGELKEAVNQKPEANCSNWIAALSLGLMLGHVSKNSRTEKSMGVAVKTPNDDIDCFDSGLFPENEGKVVVEPQPAKQISKPRRAVSNIYLDDLKAKLPAAISRPKGKKIAFGWYGGKFSHLDWLLPLLPESHHYCEPFSGSGAVLLNRQPSLVETFNDIDGEVVNFFKILRDNSDELMKAISLTPFSREEFHNAIHSDREMLPQMERARLFYVRARQARTGLAQTATLGRWANCKETSRSGMSGVVSRWLGGVEALAEIAERLLRVQIENRPAVDLIKLYDSPSTLFYCDPPYLHDTRGDSKAYGFEMVESEHINLSEALNLCSGKVAISGYRNKLMDKLYKSWRRFDAEPRQCHSIKGIRQESLWMNY
jgi:DNA adenine methylase